jgi:hypothetical protein
MRKVFLIGTLVFCFKTKAQTQLSFDSLPKNEFSFSFLPLVQLLMRQRNYQFLNLNFSYKRYLKDHAVLRSSVSLFPNTESEYGTLEPKFYDTLVFTGTSYYATSPKTRFNLGLEEIFRVKRFVHGVGVDLFINFRTSFYREEVMWNTLYGYTHPPPSNVTVINNGTPNKVDSLSSYYRAKETGLGIHVFYSLKYQINKRFIINSTFGLLIETVEKKYTESSGKRAAEFRRTEHYTMDPTLLFLGDISLGYRF